MNLSTLSTELIDGDPSLPAGAELGWKTGMGKDLLELFYKGEYQRVVALTIDGPDGLSESVNAPAVISSLTFLGRIAEAELLFEKFLPKLTAKQRVMSRFFLGVVKCRHFHFQDARKYFGANRRDVASVKSDDENLFYLYQGFGFYRYTYGHLAAAHHWAEKSYQASFRANFLFGRLFAQDLLAHIQINLGRTHLGLKLIDQNISLAHNLGRGALIQMFKVTRAIYRSRFGISSNEAVEELLTTLSETVFEDGYSRACLLAELSLQYLIRGNAKKAGEALGSACEYVYRVDNPRLEILLNFRMAALLARKGELAQALHLLRSSLKRLESHVDRLLELRLRGFEGALAEKLGKTEGLAAHRRLVQQLTSRTGYFVGRRILARETSEYFSDELKLQDPMGDLLDELKRSPRDCIPTILEHGWYGYLYGACSVDVTQKTILIGVEGKSLTLFDEGSVFHFPRGASNLVARFLLSLARGERTKDDLVQEVWQQTYHPLRHDPVIYSLVSKLRKELGSNAPWVEATEHGYQLQRGVVVAEIVEAADEVPMEETEMSPASALTYRQKQLLSLVSRLQSVDVKTCVENFKVSAATVNRDLVFLENEGLLFRSGKGRSTRYHAAKGERAQ